MKRKILSLLAIPVCAGLMANAAFAADVVAPKDAVKAVAAVRIADTKEITKITGKVSEINDFNIILKSEDKKEYSIPVGMISTTDEFKQLKIEKDADITVEGTVINIKDDDSKAVIFDKSDLKEGKILKTELGELSKTEDLKDVKVIKINMNDDSQKGTAAVAYKDVDSSEGIQKRDVNFADNIIIPNTIKLGDKSLDIKSLIEKNLPFSKTVIVDEKHVNSESK